MPVAELLKRISGHELAEWAAFEHIYGPVGVESRIDQAAALIAERITNSLTDTKPRLTQDDFMPRWGVRRVEDVEADDEEVGDDGEHHP
jgi:hypothetical protein